MLSQELITNRKLCFLSQKFELVDKSMNPVPLERKVSEQKTSIEALASPKLKPATSGLAAFRLDGDFPVTGVSNAVDEARFQREVENKRKNA